METNDWKVTHKGAGRGVSTLITLKDGRSVRLGGRLNQAAAVGMVSKLMADWEALGVVDDALGPVVCTCGEGNAPGLAHCEGCPLCERVTVPADKPEVKPEVIPAGKQFNTTVAWSEKTTGQARERIARAVENLNDPEWGDIAIQAAIEDLEKAAELLKASRAAGWAHAHNIPPDGRFARVVGPVQTRWPVVYVQS